MTISGGDLRFGLTAEQFTAAEAISPPVPGCEEAKPTHVSEETYAPAAWPYRWGQIFRVLGLPFDLLFQFWMRRTIVLGEEYLQRVSMPVIFAGTHRSLTDTPLLRQALRRSGRGSILRKMVVTAAAEGWQKAKFLHQFGALAFGLYPVHQLDRRGMKLQALAELLEGQHSLLIYPQGSYASSRDECSGSAKARFRLGVGYLTSAVGAPVVPFGLAGTEAVISPALAGKFRGISFLNAVRQISPAPMAIAFGPPLFLEPGETPRAFTGRLQQVCHALTAEAEQALERFRPADFRRPETFRSE